MLSSVESQSTHPLASALVDLASSEGVSSTDCAVSDFYSLPGEGVGATVDGARVLVGNRRLAERQQWIESAPDVCADALLWEQEGMTVGWMAVDGVPRAIFAASDAPREQAAEAIRQLRALGIQPMMVTGDNPGSAAKCASAIHLENDEVSAGLLPKDKVAVLKSVKEQGKGGGKVAFCGDGVNDAPALAAADVSLAMGATGTLVAMETADVAIMHTDLRKIAKAVRLGRKTIRKIKENVIFSFLMKVIMIGLTLSGHSALWLAVVADVGSMLIVTFNGMTLLGSKSRSKPAAVTSCP